MIQSSKVSFIGSKQVVQNHVFTPIFIVFHYQKVEKMALGMRRRICTMTQTTKVRYCDLQSMVV